MIRKLVFAASVFFCFSGSVTAQFNNIGKKILDKGKEKVRTEKEKAKGEVKSNITDEIHATRAQFDSADFDYALLLSDNSGLFNTRKRGAMANKIMNLRQLALGLKDLELTDEQNARLNLDMGQAAFASEKFFFAEKKYHAAMDFFEKAGLTRDFGYMKTIANQGLLFTTMGRYTQADAFTRQALQMREEKLGDNHMSVSASWNNYGVLHYNLGQYNEAEKDFASALNVIHANKKDAGIQAAIVMNNQAMLYQSLGRYEQALQVLGQALQVSQKLISPQSRQYFLLLSNQALLYQQMGKYPEAESAYKILATKFDHTKPEYANVLNNFATLYLLMGKDDQVEDMLKQSAKIYEDNYGASNPAPAKVKSDLGNFYRYKERYAEAEPLLTDALKVRQETLGENHPLLVQSQEDLAILYWKQKQYDKAYTLYHTVMEKSLDFINQYFPPMSEVEKTKYWDLLSPRFQRFYNFALETVKSNPAVLNDLFAYRVATKGLLLNSTRKIAAAIQSSGNAKLQADYEAWIDQKETMTRLFAYSREDLAEQGVNLDSMEQVTNTMEKNLSQSSKEFAQFYFTRKTTAPEIQQKLKADEALVEIIRLRNFTQVLSTDVQYVALVLTKNSGPKLINIPGGNDLEGKNFKLYKKSMVNQINDEQSYGLYWEPLENELKNKKAIWFSPDGIYNQISLYTLKKKGGDFLLKTADISLIGNPRDLLDAHTSSGSAKTATLLGSPVFNTPGLAALPATKKEVDAINTVLKSSGYQVAEFTDAAATEDNLRSSGKMNVLHIATHGFFLQDIDKASWPIGISSDNARENVLLRSGLFLSGASDTSQAGLTLDSTSNGVMTSYEAMNLNLKGTSLVVLSACETGLGEVKAGEGVYGLQRAFLVAGADALIMSLWKVNDAATQMLMNSFYANWTKTGDKQKAFKQAQQQLLASPQYKNPYFWGAFVMMQD